MHKQLTSLKIKMISHGCASRAKFFTALMLTLSASSALSAGAAEIIFYELAGFSGQQLTLRSAATNFDNIGFNDRAASVVVRSGTWLVCTDAEFRGTCATLARGEYRSLDARFANRISSAREVETLGNQANDFVTLGRPSIELFEQQDYLGQSITYDVDTENFSVSGFNDRASSMIVKEGTWEVCTDAGYRGTCRRYAPGRYSDLGFGMAREVSSVRLVQNEHDFPAVTNGGVWNANNGLGNVSGKLVLFDADGFRGRSMAIADNIVSLDRSGFNDATKSIVIERGTWEFCTDADFRGVCRILGPGQYRRLDAELYRAISSIRAVAVSTKSIGGRPAPNYGGTAGNNSDELVLYERNGFMGRTFTTRVNVDDLSGRDFNDRAMSLVVYGGRWQVCTDANYAGRCVVFGPGRYENLLGLNNQLSSLKRLY